MVEVALESEIFPLLSELLRFPSEDTESKARRCVVLLTQHDDPLAELMESFRTFIEKEGLERLQDVYTYTFDLQPPCPPYVGHYLFGEDYRRSYFMVGLKEAYRKYGFSYDERELPDHIAVVLAFLPRYENEEERNDLISLCLLPALEKMRENLREENPYRAVLEVAYRILRGGKESC